jgi:hypothetical protein
MAEFTIEQLIERNKQRQAEIDLIKDQGKSLLNNLKIQKEQLEVAKELNDPEFIQEYTTEVAKAEKAYKSYKDSIAEATDEIKKNTKAIQEQQDALAAGEQLFESLAESVLGLSGGFKKLAQFGDKNKVNLKGFRDAALKSVTSGELLKNTVFKVAQELTNLALESDKSIAQFKAQTGAGDEFNETIRDVAMANMAAGVSFNDVAGAVRSLKNEFTDFTYLTQQQQEEITQTTVQLEKLGFSFGTQAKIIQTATQTLGMDVGEANDLLIDLASTARSLGVDIDVLGGQFAANKDFIVRFGEDGQEVFEEMAIAAKALGTELGTLVGVVDKFKTFDEAGRIVGRFNAILGGPFLNSIDMLNAAYEDPIEGIKMLRDGFDQAGKSVEDLSGAELEAFASALGLSTSETIELLGKSNEELEIQRMNQEEMAEAARQAQSVMDKLSNAFNSLLINGKPFIDNVLIPMIDFLGDIAGFVAGAESALGRFVTVGLAAAGVAALIAAPFTGGTSLAIFAGLAGLATAGGIAATGGLSESGKIGSATPRFEKGGTIMSEQAIVHPGEMLITGGQGSEVISKEDFKSLVDTLKEFTSGGGGPQQIAVYVGQEKIDDIVVKALDSTAGRNAFSPFTNG